MQADHIQILALPLPSKQGAYLPSLSLLGCEMAVAAILTSWSYCGDRGAKRLPHASCPLPKSTPSQLLLYVKQQIGKTKKKARGPTKWGSTESLEHSQVS